MQTQTETTKSTLESLEEVDDRKRMEAAIEKLQAVADEQVREALTGKITEMDERIIELLDVISALKATIGEKNDVIADLEGDLEDQRFVMNPVTAPHRLVEVRRSLMAGNPVRALDDLTFYLDREYGSWRIYA